MARRSDSDWWEEGEYIVGTIDRVDESGRGVIGESGLIRVTDSTKVGVQVSCQIQSIEDEYILAESTPVPANLQRPVWVQRSDETDSGNDSKTSESDLFEKTDITEWRDDLLAQVIRLGATSTRLVSQLVIIGVGLYIIFEVLPQVPIFDVWFTGIANSPLVLILFLWALGMTYSGWLFFEYILRLLGFFVGFVIGGIGGLSFAVHTGLEGIVGLGTVFLAASAGGSLGSFLLVIFHKLGIMISAFLMGALPTLQLLTAGSLLSQINYREFSVLSCANGNVDGCMADLAAIGQELIVPTTTVSITGAVVVGFTVAVITWRLYQLSIATLTSVIGASFLVYVPVAFQPAPSSGLSQNFPNVTFLVIFGSGLLVQLGMIWLEPSDES